MYVMMFHRLVRTVTAIQLLHDVNNVDTMLSIVRFGGQGPCCHSVWVFFGQALSQQSCGFNGAKAPGDVRVEISKKSSGPGGQSVNAAHQAVRATHIPSGLSVLCTTSQSQFENKTRASDNDEPDEEESQGR